MCTRDTYGSLSMILTVLSHKLTYKEHILQSNFNVIHHWLSFENCLTGFLLSMLKYCMIWRG